MTTIRPSMQGSNRAAEIQDWLNQRIYHPLALRLAHLLRPTGISPNAVSVAGAITVAAAAWAYTVLPWPASALIGFGLHLSWHVIDGADGDLARLTGRTSANGEMVDGVCDYTGHVILYLALAAMLDDRIGGWAWVLAIAAGGSHIAQNNHYECMRRTYLWWAYGLHWLKTTGQTGDGAFRQHSWFNFVFGWMATDYLSLSAAMSPREDAVDRVLKDYQQDPMMIARFRQLIQGRGKALLPYGQWLGANFRTLLLGGSMILGSPLWFFLGECVALNLLLILSARRKRRIDTQLAAELRAIAGARVHA